jgi:hypothetical protein
MIFLQTNNLINQDLKSIEYLTILSEKSDFFVYQGTDGRTLIHNHVLGFNGHKFKFHDITYETYLGSCLLPCTGIIIPPYFLSSKLYECDKLFGNDILEDIKMMTDYSHVFPNDLSLS